MTKINKHLTYSTTTYHASNCWGQCWNWNFPTACQGRFIVTYNTGLASFRFKCSMNGQKWKSVYLNVIFVTPLMVTVLGNIKIHFTRAFSASCSSRSLWARARWSIFSKALIWKEVNTCLKRCLMINSFNYVMLMSIGENTACDNFMKWTCRAPLQWVMSYHGFGKWTGQMQIHLVTWSPMFYFTLEAKKMTEGSGRKIFNIEI